MDVGRGENTVDRIVRNAAKASIDFLEGDEKLKGIEIIMNRNDFTRDFEYNKEMVSRTAVIKLTVTEYTGKVNPISKMTD